MTETREAREQLYGDLCRLGNETTWMEEQVTLLRSENEALKEVLRTISLMSKEHEHDLFSATQVARAAIKETDKEGQGGEA